MQHLRSLSSYLLTSLIGGVSVFAFAPFHFWPLIFLTFSFLLIRLHDKNRKQATKHGFAWGFGFFAAGVNWVYVSIDQFGGLPTPLGLMLLGSLITYLALYPTLFAFIFAHFNKGALWKRLLFFAPPLWLVTEWIRGWLMTGFPWLWLGYSPINTPLDKFAPLAGVEFVSFIITLMSGAIALVWLQRKYQWLLIPVACFCVALLLPTSWVTEQPDKKASVALVQGNIDQRIKWVPSYRWPSIGIYTHLTQENWDADIVIWPEAAIPAVEAEVQGFLGELDKTANEKETALVIGMLYESAPLEYYNTILTIGKTDRESYNYNESYRYQKHHLLPFGEFVPFEDILRPLAPIFNLPMSSFQRGDYIQPNINAKNYQLMPAICYEIAYNEQLRQNLTDETDFILTISNDAWFGDSIGPIQHLEIAQMRALELGRPVLRATNNGQTAVINHLGEVTDLAPAFEETVLKAEVIPTTGKTPYSIYGSWPLYALCALFLNVYFFRIRKRED